ncbi:Negative regulator of ubiquitin-like proteins 1 [Chamberlinius hualienensis]
MSQLLSETAILTLVKNKLNGERIKLWLPPYSFEDGAEAEFTLELKKRYAEELSLPSDDIAKAIDSLRSSSYERYAARNQFLSNSLANLKIKIVNAKNSDDGKKHVFVPTKLDAKGSYLREQVAKQCSVDTDKVKLIAGGRVITDDMSLEDQKISVTSSMMALIQNTTELKNSGIGIGKARDEAEILANQAAYSDDSNSMMQIADQNNRPIDIPKHERKAITMALILNEKGKSALVRKQYGEAVILLLEAEKEFQKCTADILKMVDNYALLCMDIAWCYLCLGSIEDLPDAESKTTTCEEYLNKSYGPNMQRVMKIKGSTDCEAVLFVRLKLLKGIGAFYRRQWKLAEGFFKEVHEELKRFKVDDEKLSEVMSLGYASSEARMALRSCQGDVQLAVNYLMNKENERQEFHKAEAKKEELRKLSVKLGKTAEGEWL